MNSDRIVAIELMQILLSTDVNLELLLSYLWQPVSLLALYDIKRITGLICISSLVQLCCQKAVITWKGGLVSKEKNSYLYVALCRAIQ